MAVAASDGGDDGGAFDDMAIRACKSYRNPQV